MAGIEGLNITFRNQNQQLAAQEAFNSLVEADILDGTAGNIFAPELKQEYMDAVNNNKGSEFMLNLLVQDVLSDGQANNIIKVDNKDINIFNNEDSQAKTGGFIYNMFQKMLLMLQGDNSQVQQPESQNLSGVPFGDLTFSDDAFLNDPLMGVGDPLDPFLTGDIFDDYGGSWGMDDYDWMFEVPILVDFDNNNSGIMPEDPFAVGSLSMNSAEYDYIFTIPDVQIGYQDPLFYQPQSFGYQNLTQGAGAIQSDKLNQSQQQIAQTIAQTALQYCQERGVTDPKEIEDIVAMALSCAWVESNFRTGDSVNGVDHDSVGAFQQRPSCGWGSVKQCEDPVYATRKFLDVLFEKGYKNKSFGNAVYHVQRCAAEYKDRYAENEQFARGLARQFLSA